MITLKLDEKMKEAIQKAAGKKFMSMSGYLKAACEKALLEDGIDWRNEPEAPKKKTSPKKRQP